MEKNDVTKAKSIDPKILASLIIAISAMGVAGYLLFKRLQAKSRDLDDSEESTGEYYGSQDAESYYSLERKKKRRSMLVQRQDTPNNKAQRKKQKRVAKRS